MLARAGHDVTVLERDPQPLPPDVDSAAEWDRPTVPQTQHTQSVLALGRLILARRLPDVLDDLLAAGADCYLLADPRQEPDLTTPAVRRTTLEWILRVRATLDEPRIRWRSGVVATGLLLRRAGSIPQVTGVRTRDHGQLHADLMVDATGRRSARPDWLLAAGVESAEISQDCDLIAYSRFYRLRDGVAAPAMMRGNASILVLDGFGCYAFLADNRTIAVTVGRSPLDHELHRLQDPAAFNALVEACRRSPRWCIRT